MYIVGGPAIVSRDSERERERDTERERERESEREHRLVVPL